MVKRYSPVSGKESPCNSGDTEDTGSIPGLGRSPGGGDDNPLQYYFLENLTDRGAWRATVQGLQRVRHDWSNLARARTQNAEEQKKQKIIANLRVELFFLKENVKEQKKRNYINSKLKPFKRTPATQKETKFTKRLKQRWCISPRCLLCGPLISPSFSSSLLLCPLSFSLPSTPPLPFSSPFLLCFHFSVVVRKPDFMQSVPIFNSVN